MKRFFPMLRVLAVGLLTGATLLLSACAALTPVAPTQTATPTVVLPPTETPTPTQPRPVIASVELNRPELGLYEMLDIKLNAQTAPVNPYDARVIRLDGIFTAPDGVQTPIAGFWNGKDSWHVRFTPWQVGEWGYQLLIKDPGGISNPMEGKFTVTESDLRGAIQIGKNVNPAYSSRYFAYQDGTPFYGIGHANAVGVIKGGYDLDNGFPTLYNLKRDNENYIVWWPLFTSSPISNSYDNYFAPKMDILDLVLRDAQKKDVKLIFTIWDHYQLRDGTHAWGPGQWGTNGFSKLGSIDSFFTSDESWAWQENFYRYIIARWGYSTSIAMWMTVSELNGTNAYDQANPWHEKVNAYFQKNDPYHHPTTASMSGDVEWPEGHKLMDVSQVHIYDFKNGDQKVDVVHSAAVLAHWTQLMWNVAEKPNWVGEYGVPGNQDYPELFHNSNWAALASGAAMTPAEWNGDGSWGNMTPEMIADINRLGQFVAEIPLVKWDPSPLKITSSNDQVRGWGLGSAEGGLFWIQDFSLEGKSITSIRKDQSVRIGQLQISGLPAGTYVITPYNTWQGKYLPVIEVTCKADEPCEIKMPKFHADLAFKIEKK